MALSKKISDISNGTSQIATGQITQYYDSTKPASFSIIIDDQTTLTTLRTGPNTFQININNESGEAIVVDLQDLNQNRTDDAVNEESKTHPDITSPFPLGSRESFFDL